MSKKKKFMCALGNCKTQCFTCSEDEKCDKKWGGTRQGSGAKPKLQAAGGAANSGD